MTYWPLNALGMKDSLHHLDNFIVALSQRGGETAKDYYNTRGWMTHGFTDHTLNSDVLADCQWSLCMSCGAWLALHMWERQTHSSFGDVLQLARVYRGVAEFVLDYATLDCDGSVLLGPTTSPENSYFAVSENISAGLGKNHMIRTVQQLTMSSAIDAAILTQV